jgi:hypothetical protein
MVLSVQWNLHHRVSLSIQLSFTFYLDYLTLRPQNSFYVYENIIFLGNAMEAFEKKLIKFSKKIKSELAYWVHMQSVYLHRHKIQMKERHFSNKD